MRIATMLLAVVVVLVAAPAWAADLQAGADAYAQGDYATALKEWRPVAEQGEATAQGLLGAMYLGGGLCCRAEGLRSGAYVVQLGRCGGT